MAPTTARKAWACNFAHDTGEGGLSPYHREHGGDIIWEIGSGYFGCRNQDGTFAPETFAKVAEASQVKMVELKLSQGAKPGHGGVLPAAKVTPEISVIRGVARGQDCISPASHSAFTTPIELMHFIAEMRHLAGGKPAGFKLCVGHPREVLALVKAMLETGITPDFIVVDGTEGGTGAAALEFIDHLGMPLRDGLTFVHSALVGARLRERIKLGASGKARCIQASCDRSIVMRRAAPDRVVTFADLYRVLEPGELLAGTDHPRFQAAWKLARADSFQPTGEVSRAAGRPWRRYRRPNQPPPCPWPECHGAAIIAATVMEDLHKAVSRRGAVARRKLFEAPWRKLAASSARSGAWLSRRRPSAPAWLVAPPWPRCKLAFTAA